MRNKRNCGLHLDAKLFWLWFRLQCVGMLWQISSEPNKPQYSCCWVPLLHQILAFGLFFPPLHAHKHNSQWAFWQRTKPRGYSRHNFQAFRNCVNRNCHTAQMKGERMKKKIASALRRTISMGDTQEASAFFLSFFVVVMMINKNYV